jgi:hypothetical protein
LTYPQARADNRADPIKEVHMTGMNWERLARASGIGFVVLLIAAFIIYGNGPKVNDSAGTIASFYTDHRGRILTALILFGIAYILLLWFVGTIANVLREAGEGRLGATAIAMGATFVGLQAVIGALTGGLALNIGKAGDEGVVQALNTLTGSTDAISAYPFAGLVAAVTIGLTRARIMPSWYAPLGFVAGLLVVLHGTNWATSGFWSATGGYLFVTIIAGLAWTLITSGMLYMKAPVGERAPETAAARPA